MYALPVSAYITLLQSFRTWQEGAWSHSCNGRDIQWVACTPGDRHGAAREEPLRQHRRRCGNATASASTRSPTARSAGPGVRCLAGATVRRDRPPGVRDRPRLRRARVEAGAAVRLPLPGSAAVLAVRGRTAWPPRAVGGAVGPGPACAARHRLVRSGTAGCRVGFAGTGPVPWEPVPRVTRRESRRRDGRDGAAVGRPVRPVPTAVAAPPHPRTRSARPPEPPVRADRHARCAPRTARRLHGWGEQGAGRLRRRCRVEAGEDLHASCSHGGWSEGGSRSTTPGGRPHAGALVVDAGGTGPRLTPA